MSKSPDCASSPTIIDSSAMYLNQSAECSHPMARSPNNTSQVSKQPQASARGSWDANETNAFRKRLRRWFRQYARDLPWRRTRDPYAVWVSEIMLQQTQVSTVVPYFERFLRDFPTIQELADATEHDVLRQWEGLGYYRRARQLHRAAQQVVERFGGRFPTDLENVLSLPGIGRYTAGAILSISLGQQQPILEGNTIRLHARLLNYSGDVHSGDGQRVLWGFAEHLVTRHRPGELNQALMELGSRVCTPKQPKCGSCPVASHCRGRLAGEVTELPRTKKTMKYEDRFEVAVVIANEGNYLMRQCGPEDRWAGLWDFCRFETPLEGQSTKEMSANASLAVFQTLDKTASQRTGFKIRTVKHLLSLKHAVTRFRIRLDCFQAEIRPERRHSRFDSRKASDSSNAKRDWVWIPAEHLEELPLSVTGRKIAHHLKQAKQSRSNGDD